MCILSNLSCFLLTHLVNRLNILHAHVLWFTISLDTRRFRGLNSISINDLTLLFHLSLPTFIFTVLIFIISFIIRLEIIHVKLLNYLHWRLAFLVFSWRAIRYSPLWMLSFTFTFLSCWVICHYSLFIFLIQTLNKRLTDSKSVRLHLDFFLLYLLHSWERRDLIGVCFETFINKTLLLRFFAHQSFFIFISVRIILLFYFLHMKLSLLFNLLFLKRFLFNFLLTKNIVLIVGYLIEGTYVNLRLLRSFINYLNNNLLNWFF